MAETKKPLVFRDRDTKEKIPFYVKTEDVELPDGTDMGTKVAELEEAIGNAGDGTVKSVTLNGKTTEPDANGDVELTLPEVEVDDTLDEESGNAVSNAAVTTAIEALRTAIETVIGEDATQAIENFQEVLDFLADVHDDETLIGLLTALQTAIDGKVSKSDVVNTLDVTASGKVLDARQGKALNDLISALQSTVAGKISGIKANGASDTLPVDSNGIVTLPPAGSTISPADTAPQMDGTAAVGSSARYAREDHVHPHDTSKQDTLTFDNEPKDDSPNPVTSGGIKHAIDNAAINVVDKTLYTAIVANLTTDSDSDVLSASMGVALKALIDAISLPVSESGLYFVDFNYNIGAYFDATGFHAINILEHVITE